MKYPVPEDSGLQLGVRGNRFTWFEVSDTGRFRCGNRFTWFEVSVTGGFRFEVSGTGGFRSEGKQVHFEYMVVETGSPGLKYPVLEDSGLKYPVREDSGQRGNRFTSNNPTPEDWN